MARYLEEMNTLTGNSRSIDIVKGLSIFSVICAHCNSVPDVQNSFVNGSSLLLQNIGTFGVVCFFVISGMLFRYRKGQMNSFFKKRTIKLVIPWVFSATCVYLYVYLRRPPLTIGGWISFIIGNGSYLYYLSVLFLFYVVFTVLPFMRTNTAWIICEAVSFISVLFFPYVGALSPYLNPLNWIGYFTLGMQLKAYQNRFTGFLQRIWFLRWIVYLCGIALLAIQLWHGSGGSYWSGMNVLVCWMGALALTFLGIALSREYGWVDRLLAYVGKESLFIYLWHMPIAGIVANLGSRAGLSIFCLVRPFVVLAIVIGASIIARKIIQGVRLKGIGTLIGLGGR